MKPGLPRDQAAGLDSLTLHDLNAVPADVAQLFGQAEAVDPQLGLGWYRNLAGTVFGPPSRPCIHVLRRQGRAVAALPVLENKTRLGCGVLALGNYYTSLFAPALADDVQVPELAQLLRHVARWHAPLSSLQLAPMAAQSPPYALLQAAMGQAGLATFDYFCFGNWYLPVTGNADHYLSSRPGELRNTLRRMGKKFAAGGGRFEIVTAPEEAQAAAVAFSRVYQTSWKQPEPHEGFIPGLVKLCAQHAWLRMGLARVGTQVVAAQLWIVAADKANIYKLAYDPAFRQLSPGSLLTAHLMRHVMDVDKVQEVDYLTGDDAYKNQWMSHRRERRGLLAFNQHTLGGMAGWLRETCARHLKPLLSPLRSRGQETRADANAAAH